MQQLEGSAISDSSAKRSLLAAGCGDRSTWVVDLASRRVVRAPLGMDQIPSAAGAVYRPPDTAAVAEAAGRTRLSEAWWATRPGGHPGLGLTPRHQYLGRYESVTTSEQSSEPLDRAQIETRAYTIYCAGGCVDGADLEDWLEAERQLRLEAVLAEPEPAEATAAEPAPAG